MKVAVCVKEVPESTAPRRIDPATMRLDRSGEGTLNPWDLSAVEEGLRLVEAGGGEVVCVSMGPERAGTSLRKALAMGADRSVLVADEAAAGSDLVATSRVLAKALEREGADLVLFGQQSADSDGAVLWAAVAERLHLPLISQAATLEVADGKARVKRQTEHGYDLIEAPLPCVVAVSDAINEPRYPSLKGIMGAKKKPQDVLAARRPRPHRGRGRRRRLGNRRARSQPAAAARRDDRHRGRRLGRRAHRRLPRREAISLVEH